MADKGRIEFNPTTRTIKVFTRDDTTGLEVAGPKCEVSLGASDLIASTDQAVALRWLYYTDNLGAAKKCVALCTASTAASSNAYRVGVTEDVPANAYANTLVYNSTTGKMYAGGTYQFMTYQAAGGSERTAMRNGFLACDQYGNPLPECWYLQIDTNQIPSYAAVLSADIDGNGDIYISGTFYKVNSITRGSANYGIARLNPDGTLDESFNPSVPASYAANPRGIAMAYGSRLHVGFTGQKPRAYNTDGTDYATFNANASLRLDALLYTGGVLYATGTDPSAVYRPMRIDSDGSVNASLNSGTGLNDLAYSIAADGSNLLVGGVFTSYNSTSVNRLIRIATDGTLDATFTPNVDGNVRAILRQADGKIVIGGQFGNVNTTARIALARLNADGTLDTGWTTQLPLGGGLVYSLATGANGEVWVAGSFTTIGGVSRKNLARLSVDGAVLGV